MGLYTIFVLIFAKSTKHYSIINNNISKTNIITKIENTITYLIQVFSWYSDMALAITLRSYELYELEMT